VVPILPSNGSPRLSEQEFMLLQYLIAEREVRLDDATLRGDMAQAGHDLPQAVDGLLRTGVTAMDACELTLITIQCQPAILPNGEFVAGEDNTAR